MCFSATHSETPVQQGFARVGTFRVSDTNLFLVKFNLILGPLGVKTVKPTRSAAMEEV